MSCPQHHALLQFCANIALNEKFRDATLEGFSYLNCEPNLYLCEEIGKYYTRKYTCITFTVFFICTERIF